MRSVRHGMEVEREASLTEAIIQIRIKIKLQPKLDTENDAPGVAEGASKVLRCRYCYHPAQRRRKTWQEIPATQQMLVPIVRLVRTDNGII